VERAFVAMVKLFAKNFPKYAPNPDSEHYNTYKRIYDSLNLYKNAIKSNWDIFDKAMKSDPVDTQR